MKGGHPPRPRSAVGPRQALSSASCRAFQAAKRVSGCNSTEHAVAAPVSSSLAAAPSACYRCAARGGQVCHRPASRPGCPDPHASRFLPQWRGTCSVPRGGSPWPLAPPGAAPPFRPMAFSGWGVGGVARGRGAAAGVGRVLCDQPSEADVPARARGRVCARLCVCVYVCSVRVCV